VAYWKFNGNTNDETSNHNNLVVYGTISYIDNIPPFTLSTSHDCLDFSPIIGVNSNGFPELAVLKRSNNMIPVVNILDASNSQQLSQIIYFDSLWTPIKISVFDIDNDSDPEISVLAAKGDSTKVESRSLSGTLVRTINLP
jgi:hypothetical protein